MLLLKYGFLLVYENNQLIPPFFLKVFKQPKRTILLNKFIIRHSLFLVQYFAFYFITLYPINFK